MRALKAILSTYRPEKQPSEGHLAGLALQAAIEAQADYRSHVVGGYDSFCCLLTT